MRIHTLRSPWQFRRVYREGKKIECEHAVLFYFRSEEAEGPLFGFVASKRVGNAVARSRAKRLLREAARQSSARLRDNHMWIVLVARSGILDTSSRRLGAALEEQLTQEGLLREIS